MPDLSMSGAIVRVGRENAELVAPGVLAWLSHRDPAVVEIIYIEAVNEGSGDVGRYLDSIYPSLRIRVPNVMSDRLAGMLVRRGFLYRRLYNPTIEHHGHRVELTCTVTDRWSNGLGAYIIRASGRCIECPDA